MDDRIFTATIDWLAFTVPRATVDEMRLVVGGEWFETTTGFRGYPTCWLTNQGWHGIGKLGTGAPRNAQEVHVDLSAGIVSTWAEDKIRSVLTWVFTRGGHITRMDVALDDWQVHSVAYLAPINLVAYATGMRWGEIVNLT